MRKYQKICVLLVFVILLMKAKSYGAAEIPPPAWPHTIERIGGAQFELVDEKVFVQPLLGAGLEGDMVFYRCAYTLRNVEQNKATTSVVLNLEEGRSTSGEIADPATEAIFQNSLIVKDHEKMYFCTFNRADNGLREFRWQISLERGESRTIFVSYVVQASVGNGSTVAEDISDTKSDGHGSSAVWYGLLEQCAVWSIKYDVKPGTSWKGNHRRLEVRIWTAGLPAWMSRRKSEIYVSSTVSKNAIETGQEKRKAAALPLGLSYVRADSKLSTYNADGGYYACEPNSNSVILLELVSTCLPADPHACSVVAERLFEEQPDRNKVLALKSIVAAFFGDQPKTTDVQGFVERQEWYRKNDQDANEQLFCKDPVVNALDEQE